jgi:hypothetical protein
MTLKMRDCLGVIYRGEEVDGLELYVIWGGEAPSSAAEKILSPLRVHCSLFNLTSIIGTISSITILMPRFQSETEWRRFIEVVLIRSIEAGATACWFALQERYVEPPALFVASPDSLGIWSGMRRDFFVPPPALRGSFRAISTTQFQQLIQPLRLNYLPEISYANHEITRLAKIYGVDLKGKDLYSDDELLTREAFSELVDRCIELSEVSFFDEIQIMLDTGRVKNIRFFPEDIEKLESLREILAHNPYRR